MNLNTKKIDFFLIGAPKSGTTALASYLSEHPDICFSAEKEPHFFSTDISGYQSVFSINDYYKKYFSSCDKSKLWGEGSVWYFYSQTAVKEILKYNPSAKFIIMLRNPIDMIHSLHSQLYFSCDEDIKSFQKAWELSDSRRKGISVPKSCREYSFLDYKRIGLLGKRLSFHLSMIPTEQLHIIIYDDFKSDTKKTYLKVLTFLSLMPYKKDCFHVINENKNVYSYRLSRFVQYQPNYLISILKRVYSFLGIKRLGILNFIFKLNIKKTKRQPLSLKLKAEMVKEFKGDIDLLEQLLKRDLSDWKRY